MSETRRARLHSLALLGVVVTAYLGGRMSGHHHPWWLLVICGWAFAASMALAIRTSEGA